MTPPGSYRMKTTMHCAPSYAISLPLSHRSELSSAFPTNLLGKGKSEGHPLNPGGGEPLHPLCLTGLLTLHQRETAG